MKILFRTMMLVLAVILSAAACSKPENESGAEQTSPQEQEDAEFSVDVSGIGTVTVNVHIIAKDRNMGYYSDVLTEGDFTEAQKHGFDDYLQYVLSNIMESQGKSYDEAVKTITSYGSDDYNITTLQPDSKYYAVAVGIDDKGKATTEVYSKEFATMAVETSDNTFAVTVSDLTEMGAKISVKTGNNDSYFMDIVPSGVREELGDDRDIRKYLIESHLAAGDLEDFILSGPADKIYESLKPGWKYDVVVFGCKDGFANTDAVFERFTTLAGEENPALCEFEFDCTLNASKPSIFAFYPSNPMAVYICDAMFEADYQMILEASGGDVDKAGETILNEMIMIYAGDFGTRAETLNLLGTVGPYEYGIDVEPGEDYRMWAVCVDQNGMPIGKFITSEVFTAPEAIVSKATVSIKSYPWFDGDELYKLDPVAFNGAKGNAAVDLLIEPSEDAVEWWAWVFMGDLRETSDKTVIKNLTDYGMPEMHNFKDGYIVAYWGESTICAVAKDADGNFGVPVRQYVDLTKEGATPVSQLQSLDGRHFSAFPMKTASRSCLGADYRLVAKRKLK